MFEMDKSLIKVAEGALSFAFQAGLEEASEGFKNSSFYFADTVSTKMAHCGTLCDIFERSIDKWTKISIFMEGFASSAIASSSSVRSVAKFIRA